ncbi:MAG: hypothetical protein J5724_03480 [Ruminococcus sp.]|nr:hypothetical protein [Ruminococcus sp.]
MEIKTEEQELVCAVCGEKSSQTVVVEYEPDRSVPDLDMRPGEPHRSYIKYWVSKCPHCGYCNASIEIPALFTKEYLQSANYNQYGDSLAGRFMKMSLICEKNKVYEEALKACLYAAWTFDDVGNDEKARECRRAAVRIFDSHRALFSEKPDYVLVAADIMRRSGNYERVISDYKGKFFHSGLMTAIAAFEAELAEKGDSGCHRADEVPGVSVK